MEGKTRFLAEDDNYYRITDVEVAQDALHTGFVTGGEAIMITALLSFEFEGADDVDWAMLQARYAEIKELVEIVGP